MKRASCSRSRGGTMTTQKKEVLPLELITEILLRSPVKSVVRFKSVCKSWLSLISDPQFAKSHFELAASDADKLLLIVPSDHKAQSIDFNASLHDDSASHALNLNVLPPNYFHLEILGSCRGFILVIGREGLTVWNPSTGFHVSVDWSPYVLSDPDFAITTFLRGFGYDSSTDDYLVVLGSYNQSHPQEDCVTCFEYFSFRANAWKQFEPEPEAARLCYQQCSTNQMGWLYNDAIHWLAFRCDVSMNVIVAFDLTGRSISEISMPVDFVYHNMKVCLLRVLRELLSLCTVGPTGSVEIWVMEKYKVQSSWTKTIVLSFENSPTVTCFFPICSTKSGDIVGADLGTKLVKCNDKGQLQEQRSYFNGPVGFAAAYLNGPVGYAASIFNGPDRYAAAVVYKESLLSLACDSEHAS